MFLTTQVQVLFFSPHTPSLTGDQMRDSIAVPSLNALSELTSNAASRGYSSALADSPQELPLLSFKTEAIFPHPLPCPKHLAAPQSLPVLLACEFAPLHGARVQTLISSQ